MDDVDEIKPQPPTSAVMSTEVTNQLAAELAAQLYPTKDILERFSLSAAQLKAIAATPHFRTIYAEAKALWEGSSNVKDRIRQKAALLLEDSILPLFSIIHNRDIAPAARIDAFSKLVAVADMQPTRQQDNASKGDGFVLNITIGEGAHAEKKTITIDHVDTDEDTNEHFVPVPSGPTVLEDGSA